MSDHGPNERESLLERVRSKFRSGNAVPVTRAWVTREEIEAFEAALASAREEIREFRELGASPYCPTCGGCGEEGCCDPSGCRAVRCLYGEDNIATYRDALEENESLRAQLEAGAKTAINEPVVAWHLIRKQPRMKIDFDRDDVTYSPLVWVANAATGEVFGELVRSRVDARGILIGWADRLGNEVDLSGTMGSDGPTHFAYAMPSFPSGLIHNPL